MTKCGDCDNGKGLVEFANGKALITYLGHTLKRLRGHDPQRQHRREPHREPRHARRPHSHHPGRFVLYDKSFINDLARFSAAILDNESLTCSPEDAYEAAKIATALQYSFRNGVPVYFDSNGLTIMNVAETKGQ